MLEGRLKRVTNYLDSYLEKQPWAKVLLSIGGVGPRTVEAVLGYRVRCGQKGRKKIAIVVVARKLLRRVRIGL